MYMLTCTGDTGGMQQALYIISELRARHEEMKHSHVRRFINHSQFKSQGFTHNNLSAPQTRTIGGGFWSIVAVRFRDRISTPNRMSLTSQGL